MRYLYYRASLSQRYQQRLAPHAGCAACALLFRARAPFACRHPAYASYFAPIYPDFITPLRLSIKTGLRAEDC